MFFLTSPLVLLIPGRPRTACPDSIFVTTTLKLVSVSSFDLICKSTRLVCKSVRFGLQALSIRFLVRRSNVFAGVSCIFILSRSASLQIQICSDGCVSQISEMLEPKI